LSDGGGAESGGWRKIYLHESNTTWLHERRSITPQQRQFIFEERRSNPHFINNVYRNISSTVISVRLKIDYVHEVNLTVVGDLELWVAEPRYAQSAAKWMLARTGINGFEGGSAE
jgi:hypothetical protein